MLKSICVISLAFFFATTCARNPITGKPELVLISESQELQIGLKESKRVNTQLGVYPDDDLNAYLEELGLQIAHDSERPQIPWHFRVVESPAVNAFALPGGYIYFTRGILAHMNSEAALVGVLGHEIGHVTARHSVQQISREQLAGLGLGIGTLLVPEVQPFGDVLGGGLGLLFLKFGRDAERQSDELGVRYALAQGYDPNEMANFFAVLGRLGNRLDSYVPNWVSTHPDPEERGDAIRRLASLAEPVSKRLVRENEYKRRIAGLVYGDNPREGFIEGSRFMHPDLRFRLDFPDGWRIENRRQSVFATSPDGEVAVQLTATAVPARTSVTNYALSFFHRNQIEYSTGEIIPVSNFQAFRAPFRVSSSSGVLLGEAGFIVDGTMVYAILGFTRKEAYRQYRPLFLQVIGSFDRLRDRHALEIQPLRIHLTQIDVEMSLRAALEYAGKSENTFEELALLNNALLSDKLPAGTLVKLTRREPVS